MKLNKNDMMQRLTELSPRERLLSTGTVLLVLSYCFYDVAAALWDVCRDCYFPDYHFCLDLDSSADGPIDFDK